MVNLLYYIMKHFQTRVRIPWYMRCSVRYDSVPRECHVWGASLYDIYNVWRRSCCGWLADSPQHCLLFLYSVSACVIFSHVCAEKEKATPLSSWWLYFVSSSGFWPWWVIFKVTACETEWTVKWLSGVTKTKECFGLSDTVNNIHAAQSFRHLQHDRWHLPLLSVFFFLYLFVFLSFIRLHSKWSSESSRETEPKKKTVLYGKALNSRFDVASRKVSIRPKGDMFVLLSWYTAWRHNYHIA